MSEITVLPNLSNLDGCLVFGQDGPSVTMPEVWFGDNTYTWHNTTDIGEVVEIPL